MSRARNGRRVIDQDNPVTSLLAEEGRLSDYLYEGGFGDDEDVSDVGDELSGFSVVTPTFFSYANDNNFEAKAQAA